jgi:3D (Asp-Asp-Asp) domain-containing protein
MQVLSRSSRRRALLLLAGVTAFVLLYEATSIDSHDLALQAVTDGSAPDPGQRLAFSATAYCKGSVTASGVRPRSGVAAADPALLPVGSVVSVATGDSKYNGVYTVMDTGPKVKGRKLDLYIWSCHEALEFGHRPVQVTLLRRGWDPQASSPTLIDRGHP